MRAHRYRVVRPDMRGFGASTPMPRDFPWTLDILIDDFCRLMDALGVEPWARQSMAGRLGSTFPPEGVAWWTTFMGRTAVSTQIGFMHTIACADIRADVPKIACPTLVITTEGSGLATVDDTRAWQQTIPDSELLVVPGDSYHVVASDPARCAQATLALIERRDPDD
jgi:3-oxoadipate enol-lactonase